MAYTSAVPITDGDVREEGAERSGAPPGAPFFRKCVASNGNRKLSLDFLNCLSISPRFSPFARGGAAATHPFATGAIRSCRDWSRESELVC